MCFLCICTHMHTSSSLSMFSVCTCKHMHTWNDSALILTRGSWGRTDLPSGAFHSSNWAAWKNNLLLHYISNKTAFFCLNINLHKRVWAAYLEKVNPVFPPDYETCSSHCLFFGPPPGLRPIWLLLDRWHAWFCLRCDYFFLVSVCFSFFLHYSPWIWRGLAPLKPADDNFKAKRKIKSQCPWVIRTTWTFFACFVRTKILSNTSTPSSILL